MKIAPILFLISFIICSNALANPTLPCRFSSSTVVNICADLKSLSLETYKQQVVPCDQHESKILTKITSSESKFLGKINDRKIYEISHFFQRGYYAYYKQILIETGKDLYKPIYCSVQHDINAMPNDIYILKEQNTLVIKTQDHREDYYFLFPKGHEPITLTPSLDKPSYSILEENAVK